MVHVTGKEQQPFPLYSEVEARTKFPTIAEDEQSKNSHGGTETMKRTLYAKLPPELRDKFQFICSRVREVDPTRPSILWLHDLAQDPEVNHLKDPESRARFAKLVFVTNWQMAIYNQLLGVPYSESVVLRNAITPIPMHTKPQDKIRLIYHTTPHRGLELLVPVFEKIYQDVTKNIHLDVFSSFAIYGWDARDDAYKHVIDRCKNHPAITYHGYQPNEKVREALQQAHIFAYPCIWPETSCLSVIEAMSAGCQVLCPNYAALGETCANFAHMYQWHEDHNTHANIFAHWLVAVIKKVDKQPLDDRMKFQKTYFDMFYNWDLRVNQWIGLLNSLLDKHPES